MTLCAFLMYTNKVSRKLIEFSEEKNKRLKEKRSISFEQIIEALENKKKLLDDIQHPKYKHQRMFVVNIKEYVYLVPYVEDEKKIFLKTIFPSRKAVKQYLKKQYDEKKK